MLTFGIAFLVCWGDGIGDFGRGGLEGGFEGGDGRPGGSFGSSGSVGESPNPAKAGSSTSARKN